jgi:hypothetical protein
VALRGHPSFTSPRRDRNAWLFEPVSIRTPTILQSLNRPGARDTLEDSRSSGRKTTAPATSSDNAGKGLVFIAVVYRKSVG